MNVYKHKLIFELIEFLSKWNNIWGVKWKQNLPLQYRWNNKEICLIKKIFRYREYRVQLTNFRFN